MNPYILSTVSLVLFFFRALPLSAVLESSEWKQRTTRLPGKIEKEQGCQEQQGLGVDEERPAAAARERRPRGYQIYWS